MSLSDLSIDRPVLTWMMTLALATFGILGLARLGIDRYPGKQNLNDRAFGHITSGPRNRKPCQRFLYWQ